MGRPCTYYVVSKLCIVLRNLSITAASAVVIVLAPCDEWLCGDRPITRTEDVQSDCAAHLKCLTTARDATFSRVRDAEASAAAAKRSGKTLTQSCGVEDWPLCVRTLVRATPVAIADLCCC